MSPRLLSFLSSFAALILCGATLRAEPTMPTEKIAISDRVTAMLHAIDTLDWTGVRAAFADRVTVDYTSLFGGEPATMAGDDLIKTWQGLVPGIDATQHMIGPVVSVIAGDTAKAETHVRGYHRLKGVEGGETWMVAGHYVFKLIRQSGVWRIEAMTLIAYYQEGNLQLPGAAKARVDAGQPRLSPAGAH